MTTKIKNELAKMQCNQLEILHCIKELCKPFRGFDYVLNGLWETAQKLTYLKKALMSDEFTEKESCELLLYIDTYQLLARRLKNCTNLDTLKAENRIATARINRMSKSCQFIGHRATFVEVVGNARAVGSNRVTFL